MSLKIYKLNVKHGQRGVLTCSSNDNDCINGIGAARNESPRFRLYAKPISLLRQLLLLPLRELAPLFCPYRHGTCETADNLTIVKVGIRFPSFLPYRHFKRKRIVEDRLFDSYKRKLRVQARQKEY